MAAMFDFRTVRDVVAFPIRLVFGSRDSELESYCESTRVPLVLRWRRGEDGKLEGRWHSQR